MSEFYLGVPGSLQNTSLWYLPSLFFALLISRGINDVLGCFRWRGLVLLAYALTLPFFLMPMLNSMTLPGGRLPMKADSSLVAIVFILTANWGRKKWPLVIEAVTSPWLILMMFFATWCSASNNGWINMSDVAFGAGKSLFFPIAFCGILTVCSLSVLISKRKSSWLAKVLRYYGRNCLIVFVFQGVFLRLYFWTFNRLFDLKMDYLGDNPIQHQIGGFVITMFVLSPIAVNLVNWFRERFRAHAFPEQKVVV